MWTFLVAYILYTHLVAHKKQCGPKEPHLMRCILESRVLVKYDNPCNTAINCRITVEDYFRTATTTV